MKIMYVKAPFQFEIREEKLREMGADEVLIKIKACGICGTDIHTAATEAKEWETFGHEIGGIVEKVGANVRNVKAGDKVTLESCTFDRYSNESRNGRVDLSLNGPRYSWGKDPMGFGEYMIATKEQVVKFDGISFEEATLVEPMGVALDLAYTADIKLNDDVLVVGLGPIGLLAVRFARLMGARKIYAAELSGAKRRIELAKQFGADEIILTDQQGIDDYAYEKGGVDKILITAPPAMIPSSFKAANLGATIAFLGIQFGSGANITFDANDFHFKRLQLRASFAAPALYFPRCIELIESGLVDVKSLISHTFSLNEMEKAMETLKADRENAVKIVIVNE
jgi:L-iditol 2-dehydrogenase